MAIVLKDDELFISMLMVQMVRGIQASLDWKCFLSNKNSWSHFPKLFYGWQFPGTVMALIN
jgi:hypothetical protein